MKHMIDELFDTDPALAQWKRNFARAQLFLEYAEDFINEVKEHIDAAQAA